MRTGVFGSLFTAEQPMDGYAFYMPDYFASAPSGVPSSFKSFHALNLSLTRESGLTVKTRIPKGAMRQVLSAPCWGMTGRTLRSIMRQLIMERVRPESKTHRRSLQTLLMFDLFMKALRGTGPHFATFYTNNVAAAMHRFWAASFPEDFPQHPFSAEWIEKFKSEIDSAMAYVDSTLETLKKFVDRHPEYVLVIASSMGQGAIPSKPRDAVFTITDLARFCEGIGLGREDWTEQPAMVPCRAFRVSSARADFVRNKLLTLKLDDAHMERKKGYAAPFGFDERENGYFHVHIQYFDYNGGRRMQIGNREVSAEELGLGDLQTDFNVVNTAQHTREGSLIVYDPLKKRARSGDAPVVSTLDIAPSILDVFGIEKPHYMPGQVLSFA